MRPVLFILLFKHWVCLLCLLLYVFQMMCYITINYVWWKFQFSDTHFYSCKVSGFPLFINKWIKQLSLAVSSTTNEHMSFFEIYAFLTMIFNQISWASYYMYICIYAMGVFLFWGSWISRWNPYSNLIAETTKISGWKTSAQLRIWIWGISSWNEYPVWTKE